MRRGEVARELVAALRTLSRHRLGSLILVDVDPIWTVDGGAVLDAIVSRELLVGLATPESVSKLHAGAIIIHDSRIARAGVPISWAAVLERAAELAAGVAITVDEDTAAIRIVNRTGRVDVVGRDEIEDVLRRQVEAQRSRLRS